MLFNAVVLLVGAWRGEIEAGDLVPLAGTMSGFGLPIAVGAAVLIVVVVTGLLALRRWAWIAAMLLTGVALAHGIWLYAQPEDEDRRTPRYTHMMLNVAIVFYLNQRGVQAAFERRTSRDDEGERAVA